MTALRRSSRQRTQTKPKYGSREADGDDDEDVGGSGTDAGDAGADSSASEDEWRPIDKKERERRRRRGEKVVEEESSSEESVEQRGSEELEADGVEMIGSRGNNAKKRKMADAKPPVKSDAKRSKTIARPVSSPKASKVSAMPIAAKPAAVRHPASASASGVQNRPASGLDQWLGVDPPAWPSTCADAMITDRDSLFVGFVYTLNAPSQAEITQCLSHLTKVVQPQVVPVDKLPPAMQHLAPARRGATHDMYAWRALALKKGRNGLGGPDDFGLEEGQEDDGERFGAKEVAKAIRTFGATDVLVVVSRWYGGTMLGPVRFRHIEECAKAALARFMVNEAMVELRAQLHSLDAEIEVLRKRGSQPSPMPAAPSPVQAKNDYSNLDPDRAERLIMARKRQIELLKRPKPSTAPSTATHVQAPVMSTPDRPGVNLAEEEAGLQALRELEEQQSQSVVQVKEEVRVDDWNASSAMPLPVQPVKIKAEPQDDIALEKQRAKEAVSDLAANAVKEEGDEGEGDLTGWDEL